MIHFGQYIPGESLIHRLDPRVKITGVVLLSIILLQGGILTSAVSTASLLGLLAASRLSPRHLMVSLRPVVLFLLLLFSLHLLFTRGTPIPPFPQWLVTPTHEGLRSGALVSWQFALLVTSASILTMTTSPTELIVGMERILRPLKVLGIPSHDIAVMISIALRFAPTFLEEIQRIREAQMARGADFGRGPLTARARAAVSLMIPVMINAMRRADELATAMEGRGYQRGPRTYLRDLRMSGTDYAAAGLLCAVAAIWIFKGLMPLTL